MNENLYHYRARLQDVYDGDTITCHIDLGFNIWMRDQKIRLYGIDTPELRGDERTDGLRVRDWLRAQFGYGADPGRPKAYASPEFILLSDKDRSGKYGRWLGTLIKNGRNLNIEMLDTNMGERYM